MLVHEPHEPHEHLLEGDAVFRIQGAIFEVNRTLGVGFLEAVYQEALAIEFAEQQIPFIAKPALHLSYKGVPMKQTYSPDFICFGGVIVELKALSSLLGEHRAQVLNYLKATGLRVGLLVNFGCAPKARVERLVL
jgi:GxxExxY protein